METKTVFNFGNFIHQNEPKIASIVGNLAVLCGVVAAIPLTLGTSGLAVPPILMTISGYAVTGSVVLKAITKMFGTVDSDGKPVNTTLPSTVTAPTK